LLALPAKVKDTCRRNKTGVLQLWRAKNKFTRRVFCRIEGVISADIIVQRIARRLIAMRPEDILELLRARLFEPFRMHLTDGAAYEIRHPDMAIVQRSKVTVAVPGPKGPDGPAERTVNCALVHITRTELLNGSEAG
jgi:hypothetical protein